MSVSAGTANVASQTASSAFAPVRAFSSSTSSDPRSRPRLTIVISAAPASADSTAIARAAPPAPKTTIRLPAGSATVRSDAMKPWPSVFSPIQPAVPAHGAVDRADDRGRVAEAVEVLDDRDLVRDRAVEADPAHRGGAADGAAERLRRHVAVDVARLQAVMPVGGLDHRDRRVLGGRGREGPCQDAQEVHAGSVAIPPAKPQPAPSYNRRKRWQDADWKGSSAFLE